MKDKSGHKISRGPSGGGEVLAVARKSGNLIYRDPSGGDAALSLRRKSGVTPLEFPLDFPPTPGTPQFLSEELLRTAKGILQAIIVMQKERHAMLSIGRRILEIESHFISDRLGGPHLESDNDKMIGFGRLYACCKNPSEAILITTPPTADDFIDDYDKLDPVTDLEHTSLYRALIRSTSTSCPEAVGDRNGFPVSNLLTYCDQQLLCNLNGYFVATEVQDKKYNDVNIRARKIYEKPLGDILKRAVANHPDIKAHNKSFEIGGIPFSHQFEDYSAYTFMALEDLMLHLVSVQQYSVMVEKLYTDSIETAFKFMLPKLDSVLKVNSEGVVEILEMLAKIQSEMVDSPYIPIRDFIFGEDCDCKPELVLSEYGGSDLPGHLMKCLDQLNCSFDHTHEIMAIHPEVDNTESLTEIHKLSYRFRYACEHLQAPLLTIHDYVGKTNAMGKIVEKAGFTYAFDKLVETFESVFPRKKINPLESVLDSESVTVAQKKLLEAATAKQKMGAAHNRNALFQSYDAGVSNPPQGVIQEDSLANRSRRSGSTSATLRSPRDSPRSRTGSPRIRTTQDGNSPRNTLTTSTEESPRPTDSVAESPRVPEASYSSASAGLGSMISKVLPDLVVGTPPPGVSVAVVAVPNSPILSGSTVQVRHSPKGADALAQEQQNRKSPKPGSAMRDAKSLRRKSFQNSKLVPPSVQQVQADLQRVNPDPLTDAVQAPPVLLDLGTIESPVDQEVNQRTGSVTPGSSSGSND